MKIPELELIRTAFKYDPITGILTRDSLRAGWLSGRGYLYVRFKKKIYPAHRIIWYHYYGVWPSEDIDHCNRLKTDNRIENLRLATDSQNLQNRPKQRNNTSGFKGVSYRKRRISWQAEIDVDNKRVYLGNFRCLGKAIKARRKAEKTFYNNFAYVPSLSTAPRTSDGGKDR